MSVVSIGTAYFWNVEALMGFLTRNGLSHVIRAHEVQQSGFQVCVSETFSDHFRNNTLCLIGVADSLEVVEAFIIVVTTL